LRRGKKKKNEFKQKKRIKKTKKKNTWKGGGNMLIEGRKTLPNGLFQMGKKKGLVRIRAGPVAGLDIGRKKKKVGSRKRCGGDMIFAPQAKNGKPRRMAAGKGGTHRRKSPKKGPLRNGAHWFGKALKTRNHRTAGKKKSHLWRFSGTCRGIGP